MKYYPDDEYYFGEDYDLDIDVCQHCGSYFAWTKHHRKVAEKTGFTNHQRCIRCMVDETWIEREQS